MDIITAIKTRRSIRKFKSEPVPKETLLQLMEAVRWAPSWANTQCWEVIVVEDQAKKEELAEAMPPGNPGKKAVLEAPVVLVFLGQKKKAGYKEGKPVTEKDDWWYMFDVALAVENFCLYAHGQGLGSLIIGYFDAFKVATSLNIPEDKAVTVMVPVGFPAEVPKAPKRKEVEEFVHQGLYGK